MSAARQACSRHTVRMAARIHDPGGIFLRRSLRIAIVLPLVYILMEYGLNLPDGAGIASFTAYALLGLADFGGPPMSRVKAYLVTGAVGTGLVILGSLLSNFMILSIVASGVVAFAINYTGVLRGYFTAAATALLLPFVMALTSPPGFEDMFQLCVGYIVGVLASLIAAMTFWPTYLRSNLRKATAAALQTAADEVALRWLAGGTNEQLQAARELTADAVTKVHSMYDGALVRPGPGTGRDRSLVAVISELDRVDRVLQWQAERPGDIDEVHAELARTVVATLRDSAQTLLNSKRLPDPSAVNAAREDHQIALEARVDQLLQRGTEKPLQDLSGLMPLRIVALSAQSIAGNVVGAIGEQLPEGSAAVTLGGQQLWDPAERPGPKHYLVSQFKWKSPWVRNAIRTGAAIAIATAIVEITQIPHGMWIVLGTLVALRFDAGGTSRTAATVLVGTVGGFVLGAGVIYFFGTNDVVLWAMLPFAVFLACYTPGSISLAVGQATFTVYGVILYALYLPTGFTTAEFRVVDVFLAMVVSLVVSALLWPRGVVTVVDETLRSAAAKAGDFLAKAMATLTGANRSTPDELAAEAVDCQQALTLAKQSYDLAYAQKGPGLPDIHRWSISAEAVSSVERTAEIVNSVVMHGRTHGGDQVSREALMQTARCIDTSLHVVFGGEDARNVSQQLQSNVDHMREAVGTYVETKFAEKETADAKDLTAIVWLADWLQYAAWEVDQAREQAVV